MKHNLLTKTLRAYILLACLVLIVTAPAFYFITQHVYTEEASETLHNRKKEFDIYYLPNLKIENIDQWNKYHHDQQLIDSKPRHRNKKGKFTDAIIYDTLLHQHELYRILTAPVRIEGKPYIFSARINLVEREDVIASTALLFLGLTSALLIGLYFVTKIMSVRLWKPFYQTLDYIEKFEIDKSADTTLNDVSIHEFDRLNNSINRLIKKNTSIYNNQREFVENAAHELQTPLAVVQGKLEALYQQANLTSDQSEALEKLNNAVTRLIRLNRNLLLLSKIDRDEFHTETILIDALVKKNLEFFTEQASAKQIQIDLKIHGQARVKANLSLTETLISNLFLNAIKHNTTGGLVHVSISETSIDFANTGTTTALPVDKIFNRFSKIDPSSQGSGLGLAIVKKIAEANQWAVKYSFQNNLHIFSVQF